MTIEIREISIRCPTHQVPLIHIPRPIANDIVVCPECGTGGTYEQVVKKGMGLIVGYVAPGLLQELLKEAGFAGK